MEGRRMSTDTTLIGRSVPDFTIDGTGGTVSTSSMRGAPVVLYFYPKDATPGCTTEAMQFRDRIADFTAHGASILGVSRDTLKSHVNFKAKLGLPFELLADTDETLCRLFDVIKTKNMYGKQVLGIERSTFLMDAEGVVRGEWRKVKVDGHVEAVLAAVQSLGG
jgi:thioredoxin-dependent peroxiredoxin